MREAIVMKRLRAGIIGIGTVAVKAHIPALRQLGIDIIGVADKNERALKRASVKKRFTDYQQLLKEDLDFISICTPPFTHYPVCVDVAEAGVNILIEKPITLNVADAVRIKKIVEKNGVELCVVHNYKFLDPFIEIKRMQERGEIGRLLSVRAIFHESSPPAKKTWLMDESKAGSILFESIHPLYLLTWFGGAPKSVFAFGKRVMPQYPSIRDIRALIDFGEGVGYLEISQFSSTAQYFLQVTGTGASAMANPTFMRVPAPSAPLDLLEQSFSYLSTLMNLLRIHTESRRLPYMRYAWGTHYKLIKEYAEAIVLNKEAPVTIDEGIQIIKLATAIEKSMLQGRKISINNVT